MMTVNNRGVVNAGPYLEIDMKLATGGDPNETDPRPTPKYFWKITSFVAAFLTVPLLLIFLLFPLLKSQPFDSVDELKVEDIDSMKVNILNRKELDDGVDIARFQVAPADFAALLEPLRGVAEVEDFVSVRGPWLGEYRIWTKDGRRGNIKLYFVKSPTGAVKLRFQIGPHKYEGGSAAKVIEAAETAAARVNQ